MLDRVTSKNRVGWVIGGLSLLVLLVVTVLSFLPRQPMTSGLDVSALPALNATLNGVTALCLVVGFLFIRRKQIKQHRAMMLTAFGLATLFLISYVILHTFAGSTSFTGQGWIRPVYFVILISHILLSVIVLPLALTTLYLGWTASYQTHRRVARWAFPIWVYTSISGVLVYLILYHWPA